MSDRIVNTVVSIHAPAAVIWSFLTDPVRIGLWMMDTPVTIATTWDTGSPIRSYGDLHGLPYENRGIILECIPEKVLSYSFWSTLSQIPDLPENYSVIRFELTPALSGTELTFTQENLVTESIYHHSNFYWHTVLGMIKKMSESADVISS